MPSAAHRRLGLPDDGELVQCLLGTQFLDDADPAVGDDQQAEQPVDERPGGQHDQEEHAEDRVDPGEDVGSTISDDAARSAGGHVVGLAVGDPLGHLGVGQTRGQCCGGHRVNTPLPSVS